MKWSVLAGLAIVLSCMAQNDPVTAQIVAPGAKKPCLVAGGVAINLNGNFGFCYLKGRRMRPGSVFAQCKDGELTCYADEGIPDKPRQKTTCVAPEPGFCGSSKDATPAPTSKTPSPSTNNTTNSSDVDDTEVGDEDVSGDNSITDGADRTRDQEDDDEDDIHTLSPSRIPSPEMRGAIEERDIKSTVNPSALVAGNLPNGESYEDEQADDEDAGNARNNDDDDDGDDDEGEDGVY